MPTILQENGFRFFFYSNEHLPRHVHVMGKGGEAKIELETLAVVHNYNFKRNNLKSILEIVSKNRFLFIRKWDEFHNK